MPRSTFLSLCLVFIGSSSSLARAGHYPLTELNVAVFPAQDISREHRDEIMRVRDGAQTIKTYRFRVLLNVSPTDARYRFFCGPDGSKAAYPEYYQPSELLGVSISPGREDSRGQSQFSSIFNLPQNHPVNKRILQVCAEQFEQKYLMEIARRTGTQLQSFKLMRNSLKEVVQHSGTEHAIGQPVSSLKMGTEDEPGGEHNFVHYHYCSVPQSFKLMRNSLKEVVQHSGTEHAISSLKMGTEDEPGGEHNFVHYHYFLRAPVATAAAQEQNLENFGIFYPGPDIKRNIRHFTKEELAESVLLDIGVENAFVALERQKMTMRGKTTMEDALVEKKFREEGDSWVGGLDAHGYYGAKYPGNDDAERKASRDLFRQRILHLKREIDAESRPEFEVLQGDEEEGAGREQERSSWCWAGVSKFLGHE